MGVTISRGLVMGCGLLTAVGGLLLIVAGPGYVLLGLITLAIGAGLMVAALVERLRYRSADSERQASPPGPGGGEPTDRPMEPRFQRTDERFVDPTTVARHARVAGSGHRRASVPGRGVGPRIALPGSGPFIGRCYPRRPGPRAARSVPPGAHPPNGRRRTRRSPPPDARRPSPPNAPHASPAPVPQSRAVVAGVQRPRALRGARRAQPAARAGQVPGHLRRQPRRVLPGADRRAAPAGAGRQRRPLARRADAAGTARRRARTGPRPRRRAVDDLRSTSGGSWPSRASRWSTTPRSRSTTTPCASGSSTRSSRS